MALARLDVPVALVAGAIVGGQQVPHAVRAGVGRPATSRRPLSAATAGGPVAAGVGLQVQWAELIDADDDVGIAGWTSTVPSIRPYRCRMRFFLAWKSGSVDCFQVFRRCVAGSL